MKRIIIFGTGPSINEFNFEQINCDTLGINQFFRKGYQTTYYYVYDKMCLIRENPNFTSVINLWNNTIFYIDKKINLPKQFRKNTNIIRTTSKSITLEQINKDNWAKSLSEPLYIHKSTLTGAINLAYILGYNEIILAGIDGYGGYFYKHKLNRFRNKLHDSLIVYKGIGSLTTSMKEIKKWLKEDGVKIYNTNPKSFFVKQGILEYKRL